MLKPLSNRVVLEYVKEEEKKVGSLLLPGSSTVNENIARVVAVATDVTDVKIGDDVVFEKFAGMTVENSGKEYIVIKVENLVAVVE